MNLPSRPWRNRNVVIDDDPIDNDSYWDPARHDRIMGRTRRVASSGNSLDDVYNIRPIFDRAFGNPPPIPPSMYSKFSSFMSSEVDTSVLQRAAVSARSTVESVSSAALVGASQMASVLNAMPNSPQPTTQYQAELASQTEVSRNVTGTLSGAAIGSAFGPEGAVVGAIAGGLSSIRSPPQIGSDVGNVDLNSTNAVY